MPINQITAEIQENSLDWEEWKARQDIKVARKVKIGKVANWALALGLCSQIMLWFSGQLPSNCWTLAIITTSALSAISVATYLALGYARRSIAFGNDRVTSRDVLGHLAILLFIWAAFCFFTQPDFNAYHCLSLCFALLLALVVQFVTLCKRLFCTTGEMTDWQIAWLQAENDIRDDDYYGGYGGWDY